MAEDLTIKKAKWTMTSSINTKGEFVRTVSTFRNSVSKDDPQFKPEKDRYHLYVSLACPWAHRTLIVRKLKKLEDCISVNVVHYYMSANGWHFDDSQDSDCTQDTVCGGQTYLKSVYKMANSEYEGRITVPVLFDKKLKTIVNNESSEIIRMLNSQFNELTNEELDLYPENLRAEIDALNEWIYPAINNGVYKSGFAKTQEAYEEAVDQVFQGLDKIEAILDKNRYLTGSQLTEADVRLFTTLIRFDPVYVSHFKCNLKRIIDYPNIWGYVRELYQMPAFGSTTNFKHIKNHYFMSHGEINPTGIVPKGPELDLNSAHGRDTKNYQ